MSCMRFSFACLRNDFGARLIPWMAPRRRLYEARVEKWVGAKARGIVGGVSAPRLDDWRLRHGCSEGGLRGSAHRRFSRSGDDPPAARGGTGLCLGAKRTRRKLGKS